MLDDTVPVTNPNVITFGKPGGGKSTNTKNFATLMMDFGYKVFVLGDPKDEYEPLCRAFGVHPFAVQQGKTPDDYPYLVDARTAVFDQMVWWVNALKAARAA